ncbi:hypothetical protein HAX54_003454 [Datura stramonium]|uniref:RNase H type-1 domain-containing protein n=1 Tax=Datura stramonium TaxID=4076 RepID=A0ABS8T7L5_DATST|nr:hypothetical protein [Datura stramonium]
MEGALVLVQHTLREGNTLADYLANVVVDFAEIDFIDQSHLSWRLWIWSKDKGNRHLMRCSKKKETEEFKMEILATPRRYGEIASEDVHHDSRSDRTFFERVFEF